MRHRRFIVLSTISMVFFVLLFPYLAYSQTIPTTISYSGKITGGGAPITGTLDLTFRFYNQKTGGSPPIWVELHPSVSVDKGKFNVELGSINPFDSPVDPTTCPSCPLLFDEAYFLSIEVNTDGEMAPRLPLTSVGYSLNSIRSESAKNSDRASKADSVEDGSITLLSLNQEICEPGQVFRKTGTAPNAWECNTAVGPPGAKGETGDTGNTGATGPQGVGLGDIIGMAIVIQGFRDGTPVNGTTVFDDPIAATDAVNDWCGTPSEGNRCLLKIGPGIFFIGSDTLTMQPFVDVEGSGEDVTIIRGFSTTAIVEGADDAEIRYLSIEQGHADGAAISIVGQVGSPAITAKITSVTIESAGVGISTEISHSTLQDVHISAVESGIENSGGITTLKDVVVEGGVRGIVNTNAGTNMTNVYIGAFSSIGVLNLVSNANWTNVTIERFSSATGLVNDSSSVKVYNLTIRGGSSSLGIINTSSSLVDLKNVRMSSTNHGIQNTNSALTISELSLKHFGTGDGVVNYGSGVVNIDDSSIIADLAGSYAIANAGAGFFVGSSKLGGDTAGGPFTCVGVYDADTYAPLDSGCN